MTNEYLALEGPVRLYTKDGVVLMEVWELVVREVIYSCEVRSWQLCLLLRISIRKNYGECWG